MSSGRTNCIPKVDNKFSIGGFYQIPIKQLTNLTPTTEELASIISNLRNWLNTLETNGYVLYKIKLTAESDGLTIDYEQTTAANLPIITLNNNTEVVYIGADESILNNEQYKLMIEINSYPTWKVDISTSNRGYYQLIFSRPGESTLKLYAQSYTGETFSYSDLGVKSANAAPMLVCRVVD